MYPLNERSPNTCPMTIFIGPRYVRYRVANNLVSGRGVFGIGPKTIWLGTICYWAVAIFCIGTWII